MTSPDFVGTITAAVAPLGPGFLTIAAAALGIGVAVYGVQKGWALFRKNAK